MIIRKKHEGDASGLYALLESVSSELPSPLHNRSGGIQTLVDRLMRRDEVIVAEEESVIVGQLAYVLQENTLCVNITSVSAPYRNSFVLYRMLHYLVETIDTSSIHNVQTVIEPENNKSRNVLEKLGFLFIEEIDNTFFPGKKLHLYQADPDSLLKYFSLH